MASTASVLHEERGVGLSVACGVTFGLPPNLEQVVKDFKEMRADLREAWDIDVLQEANRKHYVLTHERESSYGVWLQALRMDCLPEFPEATSAGGTVDGDADQADTESSDDEDEQLDATVKHRLIHVDLKVQSVGQREAMSTISVVLLAGKFDQAAGQLRLEAPVFVRGAQSIADTVTVRMGCWVGHNVHIFELVRARLFEPGRTSMPDNLQKWFRTGLKEGSGTVGLVHGSAGVSKTTGYALTLFAECVQQGKRILALTRNTVARNQLLDACALRDTLLERCVVIGHSMLSPRAKQRTIDSIQTRDKELGRDVLEESICSLHQVLKEVEITLPKNRSEKRKLAMAQPKLTSSMEEKVRKAHDLSISCRESNDRTGNCKEAFWANLNVVVATMGALERPDALRQLPKDLKFSSVLIDEAISARWPDFDALCHFAGHHLAPDVSVTLLSDYAQQTPDERKLWESASFLDDEGGASSLGKIALARCHCAQLRVLDTEQRGSRLRPLLTSFANKLTSAILAPTGLGGRLRARPSDHVLDSVADQLVWLIAWRHWFTQLPEGHVRRADPVETSRYDGVSAITAVFLMLYCLRRLSSTHPEP